MHTTDALADLPEMRAIGALIHECRRNTDIFMTTALIQGFGVEGMRHVLSQELDDPSCGSLIVRAMQYDNTRQPAAKGELALLNKGLNSFHLSLVLPCLAGTRLARLALHHNSVGDTGAKAIAAQLIREQSMPCLTELEIGDDLITDVGAIAIASAMINNKNITMLHLGCNLIGDQGGEAFVQVIRSNSALRELVLSYNRMGAATVKLLTDEHDKSRRTRPVISAVFQGIRLLQLDMNPWQCSAEAMAEKEAHQYLPEQKAAHQHGAGRHKGALAFNTGM